MAGKKDRVWILDIPALVGIFTMMYTLNIKTAVMAFVGSLICTVTIAFIRKELRAKALLASGVDIVDKMKGKEFEEFLLVHFENIGYSGYLTLDTNDYGADLIIKKDGQVTAVQAKRWNSSVGVDAIQQVIGSKNYYKADKCLVITNSQFTPNARNLAKANEVELWDRKKLIEVMKNANGREIAEETQTIQVNNERRVCKKCGSQLVLRKGKYSEFYGCANFPRCRYTENI